MVAPLTLPDLFWAITAVLEIGLLALLVMRKLYTSRPAFFIYVVAAVMESGFVAYLYFYHGRHSAATYYAAWAAQGAVVCFRWLAIIEIAKNAFAPYPGIWALVGRLLFFLSVCVFIYSVATTGNEPRIKVLTADRAVELCAAVFIVALFIFLRYYRVPIDPLDRFLAIGFCLYSCFGVVNDSLFQHWHLKTGPLWDYLGQLTFLASLMLWLGAVKKHSPKRETVPQPVLTPEMYGELSQKLNSRLHGLNHRLDQLFRSGDSRL
jgi:hypothetical protein